MAGEDTSCFKRTYLLDGEENVEVRVWPPRRDPEDFETWMCEFQVVGLGTEKKRRSGGADSIQALYGGLTCVAATLYCSREYKDGRLIWTPTMNFDLALPVVESIRADVEADRKALEEAAG